MPYEVDFEGRCEPPDVPTFRVRHHECRLREIHLGANALHDLIGEP